MSEHFERWRADIDSMILAAERAVGYTQDMEYDDFLDDNRTIDAVVMNLIVLAEAARGVPEDVKTKYSDIPWREIAAFRNRAAHTGQTVDLSLDNSIIWQICSRELPTLIPSLQAILTDSL